MTSTSEHAAAAARLRRAATTMRTDAQEARYDNDRWRVDVAMLAGSVSRLGPSLDALTATWRQAAYVSRMSPVVGTLLADVIDAAATAAARGRRIDPAAVALARAYLNEPEPRLIRRATPRVATPAPAPDPEAAPTLEEGITAGLAWLYDTAQPDGSHVSHHGDMLRIAGNRTLGFVPAGYNRLPVITIRVTHPEYADEGADRVLTNPLTQADMDDAVRLVREQGEDITSTWNGPGSDVGSVGLKRDAEPTLLAATRRATKQPCPDHPDAGPFYRCCDWRTKLPAHIPPTVLTTCSYHVGPEDQYCDNDAAPDSDYCTLHTERIAALDALVDQVRESE